MPADPAGITLGKPATGELVLLAQNADRLVRILDSAGRSEPRGNPLNIKRLVSEEGLSIAEMRRGLNAILNLLQLGERSGFNIDQLIAIGSQSVEKNLPANSDLVGAWHNGKEVVARILRHVNLKNPLFVFLRADDLATTNQNTYRTGRIITEMRPVFSEAADEILHTVTLHQLVIEYYEGSAPKRIQFALDAIDVAELRRIAERAERKSALIKTESKEMPWSTSTFGELDS